MLEEESDKIFLDTNLSPFQLEIDWESPPKFDEYPDEEEVVIHEVEENVKDEPMKEIIAEETIVPVAGKIARAEPMLSVSTSSQETITSHHQLHGLEIDKISTALSHKGYIAMSIILQGTLSSLLPFESTLNTTTFTIFCPPDKAFFTPKYPQPPLTLIQYHVVPSNLD
ncbi:hypothetical protein RHGRI_000126 [Rhododendron griersonianum]|uniref:FAS1 domain-containing protein n=1 Tax=Rhododendron griersonianum TaxID=479676 RepID=A0AAV6LGF4_9ERIC|nr:hypothetical protein RHGRI_000126 [Rhododendron griersonianum]